MQAVVSAVGWYGACSGTERRRADAVGGLLTVPHTHRGDAMATQTGWERALPGGGLVVGECCNCGEVKPGAVAEWATLFG